MPPRATGEMPEYLVTLSDGASTIGLITPDKTGLRRMPLGPGTERKQVRQVTWSGGRGNDRLATDTTRYYDGMNAWTMVDGQVVPGPAFTFAKSRLSTLNEITYMIPVGAAYRKVNVVGEQTAWAHKFTATASANAFLDASIYIRRMVESPVAYPSIGIYTDVAGAPGSIIFLDEPLVAANFPDTLMTLVTDRFNSVVSLTAGTTYWLVVKIIGTGSGNEWEILTDSGAPSADGKRWNGSAWVTDYAPLFHLAQAVNNFSNMLFFEYWRQLYMVTQRSGDAASTLWMNGDRGVATGAGQSTTVLQDTTKTWVASEWIGAVLVILRGTNAGEYRTITDNAANSLTTAAFPVAHVTANTEYLIVGSDKWTPITLSPALGAVTSVVVANGIVYFAHGDAVNMIRMREYNNAGAWTREAATDGTNKATLLLVAPHWDDGSSALYRSNNDTSTVSVAKKVAWGVNLTFETAMDVGTIEARIRGLTLYNNSVWAGKEDSVWTLKNGKFGDVPIAMRYARDERNGMAILGWNTNLYFSFLAGMERLFGQVVDDIGPNRGTGMPVSRMGRVADFVPVLQFMFIAYDSGAGTSSVMATTSPGGDWHEMYRAGEAGQRIGRLFYQTVPGLANRLWMWHGRNLGRLVMPDDAYNPINDANMRYTPEAYVTTAWFDSDSPELEKFFEELRLMTRQLSAGLRYIRLEYKTDNDETTVGGWTSVGAAISTSPYALLPIGSGLLTGQRIRFRVVFVCDTKIAPILQSIELRANQANEVAYNILLDVELKDQLVLLNGNVSTTKAAAIIAVLESWKEDALPKTLHCPMPGAGTLFDNLKVHVDPSSWVSGDWNDTDTKLIGNITLKVV